MSLIARLAALERAQRADGVTYEQFREAERRHSARVRLTVATRVYELGQRFGRAMPAPAPDPILAGDTPEQEARDAATLAAWDRQQGVDTEAEGEEARAWIAAKLDRMAAARAGR